MPEFNEKDFLSYRKIMTEEGKYYNYAFYYYYYYFFFIYLQKFKSLNFLLKNYLDLTNYSKMMN